MVSADTLNYQLWIGSIMVILSVVFHIVTLIAMVEVLHWLKHHLKLRIQALNATFLVTFAGLYILAIHIVEIWIWAALFMKLGATADLESALYFSTISATTVGYGDIVVDVDWRLLGGFESMFGIVAFGISTAFLIAVLRTSVSRFFSDRT